ncbi:hypothetical protein, partial [Neorhizobium sp. JUb45]|uniref:hypothetical protein n=1 Tax=Neorhizobium sp. JUb45 TaxID=2485113 RepID=UPI001A9EC450
SSPVARQAHNLKAAGSNPAPATNKISQKTNSQNTNAPQQRGAVKTSVSKQPSQVCLGDSRHLCRSA